MTNPLTKQFTNPKLLSGYPKEIIYQWNLAREYVFHVGAEPRDGLLLQGALPVPDMLSSGNANTGLGVGEAIDPPTSLGVRIWRGCPGQVDDIYGDPLPEASEFNAPRVTMGLVKFDEQGDKMVELMEWGHQFTREARISIPFIHHIENEIPPPQEGDLVEFWARSWHELGVFYDVVHVARNGFINDTSYFVQWVCRLRRRDDFLPERRLLDSGAPATEPTTLPPVVTDDDPEFESVHAQDTFEIVDDTDYTYLLTHEPIIGTEDVYLNGVHLVAGAGFDPQGSLFDVSGYVINGKEVILSSNTVLCVDDILHVEYDYLSPV